MEKRVKVAVTGAGGQIGYALLFRLASGDVFGKDVKVDLNLIEITPALPALEGLVMELHDCAFPSLGKVSITDDLSVGMNGIQWAILVGSVPRKQGMERSDLLKINGGIFTGQGKAINAYAADDVRVFVVGNPCNTNCLIAMNSAPDVPRDRFYAMTRLDQNRACAQLAMKAGVDVTEVTDMTVWGNHSSTQYPDFYNAKISGKPVTEVIHDQHWLTDEFIPVVQQRGAAVIKARGSSSAASAASAAIDSVKSLVVDTRAGDSYSVCRCSQGEYDVPEGLIFSFPCVTKKGRLEVVQGFQHNAFGQARMKATIDELIAERDAVRAMALID